MRRLRRRRGRASRARASRWSRRWRASRSAAAASSRCSADIIIAADNAKFGQPEIKLGVIPGYGGTQRLTHAVGKAKAMDLILTGRMMDAAEAERAGLVARVVPAASLMEEAMKVAETIAGDVAAVGAMRPRRAVNRAFEDVAGRGRALRAPRVPRAVRHARIRRKAWRRSSRSARRSSRTTVARGYFRTQITRVTDAFAASTPGAAGRRRDVIGLEEIPDPLGRHHGGLRRAARARDHRRFHHHHAGEAALAVERGGAGEAERRHGFERAASPPRRRAWR